MSRNQLIANVANHQLSIFCYSLSNKLAFKYIRVFARIVFESNKGGVGKEEGSTRAVCRLLFCPPPHLRNVSFLDGCRQSLHFVRSIICAFVRARSWVFLPNDALIFALPNKSDCIPALSWIGMYPHSAHARKPTPHLKNEPLGYLSVDNESLELLLVRSTGPPPPCSSSSTSSSNCPILFGYGIYLLCFRTVTSPTHCNQTTQNFIIIPVSTRWKCTIFMGWTFWFHKQHHFLAIAQYRL